VTVLLSSFPPVLTRLVGDSSSLLFIPKLVTVLIVSIIIIIILYCTVVMYSTVGLPIATARLEIQRRETTEVGTGFEVGRSPKKVSKSKSCPSFHFFHFPLFPKIKWRHFELFVIIHIITYNIKIRCSAVPLCTKCYRVNALVIQLQLVTELSDGRRIMLLVLLFHWFLWVVGSS